MSVSEEVANESALQGPSPHLSLAEVAVDVAVDSAMQAVLSGDAAAVVRGWSETKRSLLKRKWIDYLVSAKQSRRATIVSASSSCATDLISASTRSWRLVESVQPLGPVQWGCMGKPAARMQRPKSSSNSFGSKYFALYQRMNQDFTSRTKNPFTTISEEHKKIEEKAVLSAYIVAESARFPPFHGCRVVLVPRPSTQLDRARARPGRVVQLLPHCQSVLVRVKGQTGLFEYTIVPWDHWGHSMLSASNQNQVLKSASDSKSTSSKNGPPNTTSDRPKLKSLANLLFDDSEEEGDGRLVDDSKSSSVGGGGRTSSAFLSHLGSDAAWDVSLFSSIAEEMPLSHHGITSDYTRGTISGTLNDTQAESDAVEEAERHFAALERKIRDGKFKVVFRNGIDDSNKRELSHDTEESESGVDAYILGKCKKVKRQMNGSLKTVLEDVYIRFPDREWLCSKCSIVVRDGQPTSTTANFY